MGIPARRSPRYAIDSSTRRGTLRKNSTYRPPSQRTHRMGATRRAPTNSPTPIAIANDTATSWTVTRNPERNSGKCRTSTSQSSLIGSRSPRSAGLLARTQLERLLEGHRRRGIGLARVLPDPLLVRTRPPAVVDERLDHAVDELLELGIALGDPGAVRLDRVSLTLQLQGVVLDDHPGEDHVVGG